jgi:hypothetical protein
VERPSVVGSIGQESGPEGVEQTLGHRRRSPEQEDDADEHEDRERVE